MVFLPPDTRSLGNQSLLIQVPNHEITIEKEKKKYSAEHSIKGYPYQSGFSIKTRVLNILSEITRVVQSHE